MDELKVLPATALRLDAEPRASKEDLVNGRARHRFAVADPLCVRLTRSSCLVMYGDHAGVASRHPYVMVDLPLSNQLLRLPTDLLLASVVSPACLSGTRPVYTLESAAQADPCQEQYS